MTEEDRNRHDRDEAHFGTFPASLVLVTAGIDYSGMSLEDALIAFEQRVSDLEVPPFTFPSFTLDAVIAALEADTTGELGSSLSELGNIQLGGP